MTEICPSVSTVAMMQAVASCHACQPAIPRNFCKPFSSGPVSFHTACHKTRQNCRPHRSVQTRCQASSSSNMGRRLLTGGATAALAAWIIQSANAKSMKPEEIQRRSREEENAAFDNRQGEVGFTMLSVLYHINCCATYEWL